MLKAALRKQYAEKRNTLSESEIETLSFRIAQNFLSSDLLPNTGCVHTFLSIPEKREVQTRFIYEHLWDNYPEIVTVASEADFSDNSLLHRAFTVEMDLPISSYGIPEPIGGPTLPSSDMDVVLVPLLAFDKSGYRVGYGKGFYDRFLKECKSHTIFIGLSFFPPIEEIEDRNEHDIPLTHCITPANVFSFRQ